MLFNSYPFIFIFLPVVLAGYFAANRLGATAPVIWLALASLTFYSFSNWPFVALLLASIAFNYFIGRLLISRNLRERPRFAVLTVGVAGDLATLGVFKYAGFVVANVNAMFSTSIVVNILLPVGISFYTFTQIAFLVDAYRGKVAHYALPHYALFVTYFPHLIAGPILHHRDMIPQFESTEAKRINPRLILYGLIIFGIGLFKKTVLADGIQPLVAVAFHQASPSFDQAWIGALAYTFQLYFDFSGYSDMAIGISLMFGIFLPLNFNSPYKATSIIDFWRRWHMTLSQFLRDYLYIPLGGNRHGSLLRYVNLMITMLLGGLWHGAAWTFVIWGALHGLYLCINHAWANYGPRIPEALKRPVSIVSFLLTFLAVVVAWVFFRADSLASATSVLSRLADPREIVSGRTEIAQSILIAIYAALAWFAPNTQEIVGYDHKNRSVGKSFGTWQVRPALLYGGAAAFALGVLGIQQHSEFIYFRF
ncbi:MBOAT family O-acyltransferase [Bradyrhizobium erythrophlei]|uniref:Probable alginate O-acetylase AlgI n=1 Tax=Bradyrhizobium erythrophlei TaxID=1437360 RepID=A0A1M7TSI9_9BRAD|nr:MBOAT family protein [Bradyrhizobium erythrophlei]SHN73724.1 D-alanyl-lipoteichoic acid acyltransferase DltB, MBOAT superfamily [Bradyrhizobium erythrophlei]